MLRMGIFDPEGLHISDKDKDTGKDAYTDYGLAAGKKFKKD